MSRITGEVQRRSYSPEYRDSSQREDRAMHMQDALASPRGWDFWVVGAFLIACTGAVSYMLGPFGLRGLPAAGVGLLIALAVLPAGLRVRPADLGELLGGAVGAVLGVFASLLVTLVIFRSDVPQ